MLLSAGTNDVTDTGQGMTLLDGKKVKQKHFIEKEL